MTRDARAVRGDRRASFAVLAGIASAVALTVAVISMVVPQGYVQARGDPRYWLLMLPVAIWAWAAVDFAAWALAVLPVVLAGAPVVAVALVLAVPGLSHADVVTLWIVAGLSLACGVAGWHWRRTSGLT